MAASIGKSRTERACAISWYSNWSLEQRNAFIDKLLEKSSLDLATESLLNDLQNMSFGSINGPEGGPSVFECQLRIFDGWFKQWTDGDKSDFVAELCQKDAHFKGRIQSIQ